MAKILFFDWWMSAEWAVRDEQPILPISTAATVGAIITEAAATLAAWGYDFHHVTASKI